MSEHKWYAVGYMLMEARPDGDRWLAVFRDDEPTLARRAVARLNAHDALVAALKALADKVEATSDCDHKRATCEEVGCIGAELKAARAALVLASRAGEGGGR